MAKPVATREIQVRDALRDAFEEHYLPLLRLCTGLSGHRDTAEDIVQDAFVRVAPRILELEPAARGPYLRQVVVNLWKDRRRRFAAEVRHVARRVGDDSTAGSTESKLEVWRGVLRLPPRQRACVVLRYYEDLSEREAAEVLGCSVGTVKSQTSRALSKLRRVLSHED